MQLSLQAPTLCSTWKTTAFLSDCLAALKRIFLNLHLALKITHLRKSWYTKTLLILSVLAVQISSSLQYCYVLNSFLHFHTSCGRAQSSFTAEVPEFIENCWPGCNTALARHGCRKGMPLALSMSFTATSSPYLHPQKIQHSQSTKPITSEWAVLVYPAFVFSTSAWETNLGLLQIFLSVL